MAPSRLAAQEPCVLAPCFGLKKKKVFRTVSEKQRMKGERERGTGEDSGGERVRERDEEQKALQTKTSCPPCGAFILLVKEYLCWKISGESLQRLNNR